MGISGKIYDPNLYRKQFLETRTLPWFLKSVSNKLK